MRFERLRVPAYGPFTEFSLEFAATKADFHLIYGPNEAGKSSLLRAIRDLLYGIHGTTPDNFLHDYKHLRIAATITAGAGRRLGFQRRKGNKNTLLDATGQVLADDALAGFLGGVDREFFTTLFGLGSEDLRRGAEALLHGRGELGQALFSANLAGTPVHRILESLDAEARTLFSGRSRTHVSIRPALHAYMESQRLSKGALLHPERWEQTLQALEDARNERQRLDAELERLRTRRDWVQRCLDALPVLGQLDEQEQRLAELPPMPDLGREFVRGSEQALTARDQAQSALEQLQLRIGLFEQRVRDNRPDPKVLAEGARIEEVHQQLAILRQWRNEGVGLRAKLQRVEAELKAGMRRLRVAGEPEAVEALRCPAEDELGLREAARTLQEASKQLQVNGERTRAAERGLEKVIAKLGKLPLAEVSALRSALAQTSGAAEAAKALPGRQANLADALRKQVAEHGRLAGAPADHRACFDLPVPAVASLRRFDKEAAEIEAARGAARTRVRETKDKQRRIAGSLARMERRGALPTLDDLEQARSRREAAWGLVLAAWKASEKGGEWDGLPLAEAYPVTVSRADGVADQLREEAEAITRAEELRLQLQDLAVTLAEAQAELDQADRERVDWQGRWEAAWSPCGLVPASPAEMSEWREHWVDFCAYYEKWEQARDEIRRLQGEIDQGSALLIPLVGGGSSQRSLAALRADAEAKVRQADQARGAHEQLETQRVDLESDLERLVGERSGLADAGDAALAAWQARCKILGLPVEVSTETGLALLDQRRQLVAEFDTWAGLRRELGQNQQEIEAYETMAHGLADGMAIPQAALEVRESALWSALEAARGQQARQAQAQADLDQELERRPLAVQALAEANRQLADRLAQVGAVDEGELRTVLGHLNQRLGIVEQIAGLRRSLHLVSRGEALDNFIERVRAEQADTLAAERAELDQSNPALEGRRDEAIERQAKAQEDKRKLEQTGAEAAEHLQQARNIGVGIRRDAARYLRLQLAIHFLREQIEQFRKQNQTPLLNRAGEVFSAMTSGSFEGLDTDFVDGDVPVLVGVREDTKVGVQAMSDGTRDQLYLALRLAAIERHQVHHEPMPVVFDDLLITFDDQRAKALLGILRQLGEKTQVMLFTHHRHLLELARQALPGDGVHLHEL